MFDKISRDTMRIVTDAISNGLDKGLMVAHCVVYDTAEGVKELNLKLDSMNVTSCIIGVNSPDRKDGKRCFWNVYMKAKVDEEVD